MIHQLDHATQDGCEEYVMGRDSLTAHIRLVTCPRCRIWLRDPLNLAQAMGLEERVTGIVRALAPSPRPQAHGFRHTSVSGPDSSWCGAWGGAVGLILLVGVLLALGLLLTP